jgi:FdhD protein
MSSKKCTALQGLPYGAKVRLHHLRVDKYRAYSLQIDATDKNKDARMQRYKAAPIVSWRSGTPNTQSETMPLIAEEPLSIRVQGRPYVVVMRTPGDELAHAAGLCLAEGLVRQPSDIRQLAFCDGEDTNTVTVTLEEQCARRLKQRGDRRSYISQTGCGLCGKELIQDLYTEIKPVDDHTARPIAMAMTALADLHRHQPLRSQTRAAHAAVVYDRKGGPLAAAEDVGRHNALDKVIGRLFLDQRLTEAALVVLSSRISYELVQKAACARIPIIVAVSRPTALAVALAARLNITLASRRPEEGLWIYTDAHRLTVE